MKTQKKDSNRPNGSTPDLIEKFEEINQMILKAQKRIFSSANKEIIDLYWQVGKYLHDKVEKSEWGDKVVQSLADYIHKSHPKLKGFSKRGLYRMHKFYRTYKGNEIVSAMRSQISWTHHRIILSQAKSPKERLFYMKRSIEETYSSRELERQIKSSLYERSINSSKQMSESLLNKHPDSSQLFRDPYMFEFLDLPLAHKEKDLRKGILRNLSSFILEAGRDFSLIGEEYRIQVGMEDFYIDILLFHRGLQCLVAVELKIEHFKPQHLGQLNFYLEALDRNVRKAHENPSVGIILCKSKDKEVVEFSLNRQLSPALVAEYKTQLPEKEYLQHKLYEIFLLADSHADEEA